MVGGFKSIANISLLIILLMYMYSILGVILFSKNDPVGGCCAVVCSSLA
jgi:hypothetical protein